LFQAVLVKKYKTVVARTVNTGCSDMNDLAAEENPINRTQISGKQNRHHQISANAPQCPPRRIQVFARARLEHGAYAGK